MTDDLVMDVPKEVLDAAEAKLHCEKFGEDCDWCYHARWGLPAALDAIPDGWAKVDGVWAMASSIGGSSDGNWADDDRR